MNDVLKAVAHVNSTGRGRVTGEHVRLRVVDGDPRTFEADFDLAAIDAPPEAAVVVEAGCAGSSTVLRFDFGTAASPRPPADRSLGGLYGERVYFNVKLVDVGERRGRLIARGLKLRPEGEGPDDDGLAPGGTLLPVELSDELGGDLWRVDIRPNGTFLLINRAASELKPRINGDPAVMPLVLPAVLRHVLSEAVLESGEPPWRQAWAEFAALYVAEPPPPPDADRDARVEWVEEVVAGFLSESRLRPLDLYQNRPAD